MISWTAVHLKRVRVLLQWMKMIYVILYHYIGFCSFWKRKLREHVFAITMSLILLHLYGLTDSGNVFLNKVLPFNCYCTCGFAVVKSKLYLDILFTSNVVISTLLHSYILSKLNGLKKIRKYLWKWNSCHI